MSGVEPAAEKGLDVFHSCSAPPLLSSTKHIVESEDGLKWIAVIPTCSHSLTTKQNLTTAFKMQSQGRRCTVQGVQKSKVSPKPAPPPLLES